MEKKKVNDFCFIIILILIKWIISPMLVTLIRLIFFGTSRASISGVNISKVSISETSGINKQKRIDFLFFFF